ncbi:MAG: hypothetical protein RQ982_01510 [Gammaproteobacteria bacterium]|nr:hypothetical protein [Gammaproteobacteria bacterium]
MNTQARKSIKTILFLLAISACNISFASDSSSEKSGPDPITHGEEAHQAHCYKCHTDSVYTRENRFVKSLDALSKQVVRCKDGSDIPWFDEDADAVVQFLNKKYYRF